MEEFINEMEMPTPCQKCGDMFDLNDGYASNKWYSNTTICSECHAKEQDEIEQDEFWEMINYELGETLDYLKDKECAWAKLTDENRALIIQLVSQRSELLLKQQSDWLVKSTTLSVEAIVEFQEKFKQ